VAKSGRQYEAVKFTFGPVDIQELGQKLARETQNVYDLERQKKEIDTDMAAQIKGANNRVAEVTTKLNNGFELREVEVLVIYDEPRPGIKRIVRIDTNEQLREEAMTLDEMQRGFGFSGDSA
jgi:plasmid maintenance system antidote protein VapI